MKNKITTIIAILICITTLQAQNSSIASKQYSLTAGKKSTSITYHSSGNANLKISNPTIINETDPCNCWIQRDTSWSVVPFDGTGNGGGPGVPPYYNNDDWSTAPITLPFQFCFYGVNENSVVINNNGNITFNTAYSGFTSDTFPSGLYSMIAPFWSDVDTRGPLSGVAYYKLTNTALIIQWDHVGYYQNEDNLLNTYQLILTDGNDPLLDAGKNVSFCYQDMQWTTGDASQGSGGFGGLPAVVGVNQGNGTDYIQIGKYNLPGYSSNGPFGLPGGVDVLDNQSYSFSVCSATNAAPLLNSIPLCDTLEVCIGDTLFQTFSFLSPEIGQVTSIAANFFGMTNATIAQFIPGNVASATLQFVGNSTNAGYHYVEVTATDNGTPQQSFTTGFQVHVKSLNSGFTYIPNPAHVGDTVIFIANDIAGNHAWDFGDGSAFVFGDSIPHIFTGEGNFLVTHSFNSFTCGAGQATTDTVIILSVGVSDVNNIQTNLFPNPTNGNLKFIAKDVAQKYHFTLTDVQGRIVFEKINLVSNDVIDISSLEKGIYFYQINGVKQGKIVKE